MGGDIELDPNEPPPQSPSTDGATDFWGHVQRHKVIQWSVGYFGAALALAQGADLAGNAFDWPNLVSRVLMLVLIAGLPLVVTVAWYHGHRGLRSVSAGELGILSVLILIGAVFFTVALRSPDDAGAREPGGIVANETPATSAGAEVAPQSGAEPSYPPNSIAVLPFANISSDEEQEYFVDGQIGRAHV